MGKSLYAQYIEERLGKKIIETTSGFATYFYIQDGAYIEDIYVHPDFRMSGEASKIADQIASIARDKGYQKMYGSIKPSAKGSTESLKVLLAYGFSLLESNTDSIFLVKGI